MGLGSWLRARASRLLRRRGSAQRKRRQKGRAANPAPQAPPEVAPGFPASEWEELSAYLPVDATEHRVAWIVAAAIAAGDRPESSFAVKRVSKANPEYARVACIAPALGAGALEQSSFKVKRIYRKKVLEETNAA